MILLKTLSEKTFPLKTLQVETLSNALLDLLYSLVTKGLFSTHPISLKFYHSPGPNS